MAHLAQGQAVTHDHRTRADEALPTRTEQCALDRASCRIGAVEHPYRSAMLGRGLEHIEQRRNEGVDATADVLQVDQHDIEGAHRLAGRAPHLAVEAEHRTCRPSRCNRATPSYCPGGRRERRCCGPNTALMFTPAATSFEAVRGRGDRGRGATAPRACPRAGLEARGRRAGVDSTSHRKPPSRAGV